MTRLINPDWHNTLEFLAGMLPIDHLPEFVDAVSQEYSHARKSGRLIDIEDVFGRRYEIESVIQEVDLLFRSVYSLQLIEIPDNLQKIIDFFADTDFFWTVGGPAQAFLLQNAPAKQKEEIADFILSMDGFIYTNDGSTDYSLEPGFKIGLPEIKVIVTVLKEAENYPAFPAGQLTEYLVSSAEAKQLLSDHLNSRQLNSIYAGRILTEWGDHRVIEPLIEIIKEPPRDMKSTHYHQIFYALNKFSDLSLPLLEESLAESEGYYQKAWLSKAIETLRNCQ